MAEGRDSLTADEQKMLDEYVARHIALGLSTEPSDRAQAERIWREAAGVLGIGLKHIEWVLSPLQAAWGVIYHSVALTYKSRYDLVNEQVEAVEFPKNDLAVDTRFEMPITADMQAMCERIIRRVFEVEGHAPRKLKGYKESVQEAMERALGFVKLVLDDRSLDLHWLVHQFMMGQQNSAWWWHYQFYEQLGHRFDPDDSKLLAWMADIGRCTGWWIVFGDTIYAAERMSEIHMTPDYRHHRDLGPSMAFRDGLSVYALNNVLMQPEHVLTPADDLTPEMVLKTVNADQRRELLRKMGMTNFAIKSNARCIDEETFENDTGRHKYRLLMLNYDGSGERPYLEMINPSLGTPHVEGVGPDCRTVRQAISFRKNPRLAALPVDDVNGADYYQQGDVQVWDPDATSVKFFPKQLT